MEKDRERQRKTACVVENEKLIDNERVREKDGEPEKAEDRERL